MKVTLDLPDGLYRRVKARGAMEGRPVRTVAMELFQTWLAAPALPATKKSAAADAPEAPWLAITQRALRPGLSHDPEAIRRAIAAGWSKEIAAKSPPTRTIRRP